MHKPNKLNTTGRHLAMLQNGQEKGLAFFYKKYYGYLIFRTEKATKDECTAESIAQEAFLRLWLFRENLQSEEELFQFLKTQIKSAVRAFYSKTRNRFHRSLLRLDGIEDYQEFLLGYELEDEEEEDIVYLEQLEEEKKEKLQKIENLLPHLRKEQQLFLQLCLKYSFNYERIAYYLGGISDYEVSLQVEKTIETLRQIFQSAEKIEQLIRSSKYVVQGEINEQQEEIFRMRYDLQFSFDQIAEALNLNAAVVKKLFIEAHAKIKQAKKTA
ncbi:sigma-70 family RNA polymerase sigma factor [Sphingobacterium sp. DN00404]|uniref:Sigma-70 family RNA polymerase sigma factor n=1 Tax=Sphingobacterium micropteri TaxID=2763501 RepID=A0ABR7YS30_9SPHI|nr:sigma-70 family RNA polymerase sigma factor [Sphingobacterium micropteri]MBD1434152.1 sigma-70 family RNA polymerase sigma factor [Sphingobacterium micropteri]